MENFEIDPDILAIMNENSETEFSTMTGNAVNLTPKRENSIKERRIPRQTNEIAVQTSSLDSKGNILNVGDKVVVGNDKAIGRIVALGRYATVRLKDEGDFEFPCSVLTLAKNQEKINYFEESEDHQDRELKKTGKFSSYTVESLMKANIGNSDNDNFEDGYEVQERLREMGEGIPFNLGK